MEDPKSLSNGSVPVEEASSKNDNALIFQIPLRVCRNWHLGACITAPGCRGFKGPVPPPLSMKRSHPMVFNWRGW